MSGWESVENFFGSFATKLSSVKAALLGNGMDKIYIEALKLFDSLPEEERNYENLSKLFQSGIIKVHEGKDIRILLAIDDT